MSISRSAAEKMVEQGAARLRQLDALEAAYGQEPEEFAVVRVQVEMNGHPYSYAFIRGGAGWYATGTRTVTFSPSGGGVTWEVVCEWLAARNVLHFEVIPPPAELKPPAPEVKK